MVGAGAADDPSRPCRRRWYDAAHAGLLMGEEWSRATWPVVDELA